jgi:hypothetical protein
MKLIKENLDEDFSHSINPDELYVVCKSGNAMKESLKDIDTVYTDLGDARPHAMYLNSVAYKNGTVNRATEYTFFSIQDLINIIIEDE